MKRILIVFMILLVANSSVFADGYGAGSGQTVGDVGTPTQDVKLNLSSMESYAIGFSTDGNPVDKTTAIATTELKPSAKDSTIADNSAETSALYVWWDITTTKYTKVTLSKSGNLSTNPDNGNSIKWSVTGADGSYSSPVNKIEIGLDRKEAVLIDSAVSDNTTLKHTAGKQQLMLETESLTGKPQAEYSASLILTITNTQ